MATFQISAISAVLQITPAVSFVIYFVRLKFISTRSLWFTYDYSRDYSTSAPLVNRYEVNNKTKKRQKVDRLFCADVTGGMESVNYLQ